MARAKSGTFTYVREGGPRGRIEHKGLTWRQATDLAGMNVYDNGLASRADAQRWEAQIREGEPITFGQYTWTITREGAGDSRRRPANDNDRAPEFLVVEKKNPLAVHCRTWSRDRADAWIERYGDSKMFMDKTLTKASFTVVERGGHSGNSRRRPTIHFAKYGSEEAELRRRRRDARRQTRDKFGRFR